MQLPLLKMEKKCLILSVALLCISPLSVSASSSPPSNGRAIFQQAPDSVSGGSSLQPHAATPNDDVTLHGEQRLQTDKYIFGSRRGYFHASLDLSLEHTDNLYNVNRDWPKNDITHKHYDHQDNILTQLAPTIWLALPRRYRVPVHISSHNTSPGGLQFTQPDNRFFNKYQLYLSGGLNFKNFSENSELNHTDVKLEGLFQYNPKQNLTFQVTDQYVNNQDLFDISNATENNQRVYDSNLFIGGVDWQPLNKLSVKLDYTNFALKYDDTTNDFLNRTDNGLDLHLFYDYSPKTNMFFQYRYFYASFDGNDQLENGNVYLYLGVNWRYTVKTTFLAKIGYQAVDYDNEAYDDPSGALTFEIQANWKMTAKTSFLLDATYSYEQTDSVTALNKRVFVARIGYEQQFTDRLRGAVNFIYENSDYEQLDGYPREDDRYFFKPELQYAFRKWLHGELSYSFDTRDSSREELDYKTNNVKLGLNISF